MEDVPDGGLHFWGENKPNALLQQGVNEAKPSVEIRQEFSIVPNAPKECTGLISVVGHGHLGEHDDLVSVKTNAGGRDGVSQKIGVGGAKLGLGGNKFEVVLPKAFEDGADVGDMGRGVGVEGDDVVEVCGDPIEVYDDLVDDLDEPPGRGLATLRHGEPLE